MPAPSITVTVEDLSARVNSTGTYNTAIVIAAKKGPIDKPIKVTGQTDFLRKFAPDEKLEINYDVAYFEAYRYLEQQNGLYVVRAAHTIDSVDDEEDFVVKYGGAILKLVDSTRPNITLTDTDAQSILPVNQQGLIDPETYSQEFSDDDAVLIYGADAGAYNNDISVVVITNQDEVKLEGAFKLVVYKKGVKVEEFVVSLDPKMKNGYGATCYIEEVLQGSNYIRALVNDDETKTKAKSYGIDIRIDSYVRRDATQDWTLASTSYAQGYADHAWTEDDGSEKDGDVIVRKLINIDNVYTTKYCTSKYRTKSDKDATTGNTKTIYTAYYTNPEVIYSYFKTAKASDINYSGYIPLALTGGNDGSEPVTADRIRALKTLGNMNDINIQLVLDGGYATVEYHNAIADLCDKREKSCHGIITTQYEDELAADALGAIKTYRNYDLNLNNYSMEMYTPHQKYYDEFNDRYIYLSPGPYVAALVMQTAQERGWHWAVAGYNRGIVPSLDVAKAFEPAIVDELSDIQVNTIIKDPGAGNVIWDELTQWSQAADLQDAHIARYVNIYLRPRLKELLKSFLFEFNDEITRSLVVRKISSFMEPQKAARAVYAYRVVCDESNNLDDDIENNIMNCWLLIKPTKIAKFIRQKIVLSPYNASLEELEF